MKRRDFLKSVSALAASTAVTAPAVLSPAKAQSRQETLLIVSESGPNNLDIHGVGTNVPGYEVSWNCYDRLISHEMKTGPNGVPYYDRDKFKPELAEDMNVGDMSVTFKLQEERHLPGRHAGHRQRREMVARPRRDRRRLPDLPDGRRLARQARAVRRRRRQHLPRRFHAQGPADRSRSRGDRAVHRQFRAGEEECHRKGSVGHGIHQAEHRRQRRLQGRELDAGTEVVLRAQRRLDGRPATEDASPIIWRMVPSAGNRRALLERGDADISYDLPNKDFVGAQAGRQAHRSFRRRTPTASNTSA